MTPSKGGADIYREDAAIALDPEHQQRWKEFEDAAKAMGTDVMMMGLDLGWGSPKYKELQEYENRWRESLAKFRGDPNVGKVYPLYVKMENPLRERYEGLTDPYMAARAIANGHDGIIIETEDGDMDEIVVFNPRNLKSAEGNNGRFDPDDPNIYKSAVQLSAVLKYDPNQPRHPKGNENGGQFARVSGGPDAGSRGRDGGGISEAQSRVVGPGKTIQGVHFSTESRQVLSGRYFGSGMRSSEANRVLGSEDPRIKNRIYAYVDEGDGVFPESGVGGYQHKVTFKDLYDIVEDPDGICAEANREFPQPDLAANRMESLILDRRYNRHFRTGILVGLGTIRAL